MVENRSIQWGLMGASIRGASHVRSGRPNQDAIRWFPESGKTDTPIMTVSDGHGSPKCFRSDAGSEFAVRAAVDVLREFLETHREEENLSVVKRMAEDWLPKALVRNWTERVDAHLKEIPFSKDELSPLSDKDRSAVENNTRLAYGATLITAVVTKDWMLFLQLGDGDILTAMSSGESERPMPTDERLMGNETTTLCVPDAWKDFRFRFQPLIEAPKLILLATDGYANSFRDDAGFLKVATDIREMLIEEGPEFVEQNLPDWLKNASESGSGDDITVGIVYQDKCEN